MLLSVLFIQAKIKNFTYRLGCRLIIFAAVYIASCEHIIPTLQEDSTPNTHKVKLGNVVGFSRTSSTAES